MSISYSHFIPSPLCTNMSTAFATPVITASTASVTPVIDDQRPPNRPLFVELNHFYSKRSPAVIRQHLEEICIQMGVDVMPGSDLFSMTCLSYVNYASVEFLLSIFTDDIGTEERYLIEIQRRNGDGQAFQDAVRGLRAFLGERKVIEKAVPVKRGWGDKAKAAIAARTKSCGPDALARLQAMHPPNDGYFFRSIHQANVPRATIPLPSSAYASFPIAETDVVVASVNHAVSLAASPYEDVKSDALQSLACMASHESQQALIVSEAGVKSVVACLQSFTADVHRCAASTLANLLSASGEVASAARVLVMRYDGAGELFRLIIREKSENQLEDVSPQALRECARALLALYGGDSDVSRSAESVSAIQKMRAHYCPLVREYAERLDAIMKV